VYTWIFVKPKTAEYGIRWEANLFYPISNYI